MTDQQPKDPRKPWVSLTITAVLVALSIQDQLTSGSIDWPLLAADLVLVAFWMGRPIDVMLDKWSR